ncbi:MAG: class II fructose-bisphosphate aldolase [Candidatus Caenarcaniphilales bacterium]|nr:class II fructose-bisphosphate aldolase [Candidatus Caenarcaniphilales bacterium]
MPVANYEQYCEMLDRAKKEKFAYPAVNITSLATINATLKGLAEAKSDGIIQVSTGGAQFASGLAQKDMVLGAIVLAEAIHRLAEKYDIMIALHTDHCHPAKVDTFLKPLIEETAKRRAAGLPNLFNSHMFDGSELPLAENMKISKELMELCTKNEIILEVETGVVGGEEDGVDNSDQPNDKLYTSPEDMLQVWEELSPINERFMLAATFGNVHGVYKPGNVKLTPSILKDGQAAVQDKFGKDHLLVFHGGSGSDLSDIHETLNYGVIKMNIDTDTQYTFTRPIVDHIMTNYEGVLKIEGEVGNKKVYDPRSYIKKAEENMSKRIIQACEDLKSAGKSARALAAA